jgi:tetratricopeptide (TPR) repeat protein
MRKLAARRSTGTLVPLRLAGALAFLCVVAAVVVGCATAEDYIDTTVREARGCAARRDYERAHELIDAAASHLGEEFDLVFEKADIHARAREFDAAREWYARAFLADPNSWKALARGWEAEFMADGESDESLERVLVSAREFDRDSWGGGGGIGEGPIGHALSGQRARQRTHQGRGRRDRGGTGRPEETGDVRRVP